MNSPSPRPTREQVDAALVYTDDWGDDYTKRLAAEVRALRAELDRVHSALHHESDAHVAERGRLRAALVARTPQSAAEQAVPDLLAALQESLDVARRRRGPLPAVPDGEDATACMNCGLPLGPPERWDQAQVGPVHHGCPAAGDDVPARLDAASELAALRAQRDAVLALHRRAEDGTFPPCCAECLYCDEDGEVRRAPWPCPTAEAAGVGS